jgi:hypothetical protein
MSFGQRLPPASALAQHSAAWRRIGVNGELALHTVNTVVVSRLRR